MLSSPLLLRLVPLIFTFLWSTGWIVAGYSARYADALTFLVVRYACAGLAITALALAMGAPWPKGRRAITDCIVTGLLLHAAYLGGVWWAVRHGLPAGISGLIAGLQPILTALFAPALLGERISLTRWAGGLENYGAAYSWFVYLWEQAGGNGGGNLVPDGDYDATAGDLLIKLIFQNQADSWEGIESAINAWEAQTGGNLPDVKTLYQDWVVATYVDKTGTRLSWLGAGSKTVTASGAMDGTREAVGFVNLPTGDYVVEITRTKGGEGTPVAGTVNVRAAGGSLLAVPFVLTGARAEVAHVKITMQSRLVPADGPSWGGWR